MSEQEQASQTRNGTLHSAVYAARRSLQDGERDLLRHFFELDGISQPETFADKVADLVCSAVGLTAFAMHTVLAVRDGPEIGESRSLKCLLQCSALGRKRIVTIADPTRPSLDEWLESRREDAVVLPVVSESPPRPGRSVSWIGGRK
jgi:hypothetical protein